MKALVPKGYFIDRFPTESTTASEIQAREVEASRKVLQDQVAALEAQAQSLINKRMNFFAPHFGLKPQKGIADTYLLDEQGNWKGVTTGAAANSIANEIMLYKDPAPSSVNLTQVETVGLIMNMIKRYELTNQINSMGAQRTTEDIKEFYSLKRRPTYEEFKATLDALKETSWGKYGVPLGQGKYNPVTLTNIFGYGYWVNSYQPINYEASNSFLKVASHPSGFKLIPAHVLSFYQGAYKAGKPQSFWQYCSQYRLGLTEPPRRSNSTKVPGDLAGKVCVALYRVDPFTGAPMKNVKVEDVVAYGAAGSESSLLATVKGALFPEVYTLEAGVNYQVGDAKVRYRSELQSALNMWNGVADKLNTPLVSIASQDGTVTKITVYLQPTGIEAAMAKLVKGDPFQAWFDSMLGTKSQVANDLPKKMLTSQITESDWRTVYTVRFQSAIDTLENAMTHPGTYITGITTLVNRIRRSDQNEQDVNSLLTSVQWPTGVPTKLFEVHVDDTRDANIVINTLFTYLEEESLMKPPEMYFAEAIQARLDSDEYVAPKNPNVQSTDQAPDAGKTYNYEVVTKQWSPPRPLPHKYTRVETFPGAKPVGGTGNLRRYFTTGKTVVSKRTITGAGSGFLKEATQLREVENRMTPMSVQMGSMAQEELNLLIGVGALALIGGILLFKQ